jgi:transposase InsO family protein
VLLELSMAEQRYDAVMEVLREGLTVTEVAERYDVSRQSVHAWIDRYEREGIAGLADRSHKPHSCPHQIAPDVEAMICELRRVHPDWGPRRLVFELAKQGIEPCPSRATAYRILVRSHLIAPKKRRRRKADYRRFERAAPMHLWQLDVMGKVVLADGTEVRAVTGIDDHSRFCVIAKLVERATARPVCAAFTDALSRYGIPDEVLTDNGKVFSARRGKNPAEVLFDRICTHHGIAHLLTGVRAPTTIGKIERFHETLRRELFSKATFSSLEQAQKALDDYVDDYNYRRPHQGIGMATPAQRFQFGSRTHLPTVPPAAARAKRSARNHSNNGVVEVQRVVFANGHVSIGGHQFSVGRRLAGTIVTLRLDGNLVHVFARGQLVKSHPWSNDKEVTQIRAHRPHKNRKILNKGVSTIR